LKSNHLLYPFNEQITMDIIIQTDKTMYPSVETHQMSYIHHQQHSLQKIKH
jgi:hypothetical protein